MSKTKRRRCHDCGHEWDIEIPGKIAVIDKVAVAQILECPECGYMMPVFGFALQQGWITPEEFEEKVFT